MRNLNLKFILISIFMFGVLFAQTIDTEINKPTNVYVGTPITLNIRIETGINDSIFSPKEDTLDIFIVYSISQKDSLRGDKKISHLAIKMAPFDTGEHQIPSIDFTVKSDKVVKKISSQPIKIFVKKVTTDSTKTITDISPLMDIKPGFWDIAVPLFILILLIALLIFIIKKMKPKELEKEVKIIDTRPAYLKCLEKLNKLKNKKLLERGNYLEFYFNISLIMREFIELEFKINAVEMSNYEIKKYFPRDNLELRKGVLSFLEKCDKVKFAKFTPSLEESREILNWFEDFLIGFKKDKENSEVKNNV